MKTKEKYIIGITTVFIVMFAYFLFKPQPKGNTHFFDNAEFDYQTIRALTKASAGGASLGEITSIIHNIREENLEDWYREWYSGAERAESLARMTADPTGKGTALFRANNYYKTAEFYLEGTDPRRKVSFSKSVNTFQEGLRVLKIPHKHLFIPYGKHYLEAYFFPPIGKSSTKKPLIIEHGGFDSTLEENYFFIVPAATKRGYPVLIFSGPGQGSVLRDQGLTFIPEWEKPTGAVIDYYYKHFGKPYKIVLIGISFGGYLAPRAAAFDKRIDGVIAHHAINNMEDAHRDKPPRFVLWFPDNGFRFITNLMMGIKARFSLSTRWALNNARWTFGTKDTYETYHTLKKYRLEGIAENISCAVLLTSSANDSLLNPDEMWKLKKHLINAKSVTTIALTEKDGAHVHCAFDIADNFQAQMFDWIENKFNK